MVYPDVRDIREVSKIVASSGFHKIFFFFFFSNHPTVCKVAIDAGLATKPVPEEMGLDEYLDSLMYKPAYQPLVLDN
jgi:hypothetical protein